MSTLKQEKAIVYFDLAGTPQVVIPSPFCEMTLEEIAAKDVPPGFLWSILDVADLPIFVPDPTTAEVDMERDRRIAAGFTFAGTFFQSRPDDRENISGASTAALGALVAGAQDGDLRWTGRDADFTWIAADNSEVPLDAKSMFALGSAAMAHKEAHIRAARALKNMDPIPSDFATNPAYWP